MGDRLGGDLGLELDVSIGNGITAGGKLPAGLGMMSVVACYGGAPDVYDPWERDFERLQPLAPLGPLFDPQATPNVITVEKIRDLTDEQRAGLVKLLPLIEAALDRGEKLDREQIAAYVLLQSLAEGSTK